MTGEISLGQLEYINCLPINYPFDVWHLRDLLITKGSSAFLDNLMAHEQLHIAPVSAIEYLRQKSKYSMFRSICIASKSNSRNTVLFSIFPLYQLENKTIALPKFSESASSIFKIILKEYGIKNCNFVLHTNSDQAPEALKKYDAILYEGNFALLQSIRNCQQECFFYDLANEWANITDLPLVHTVWVSWSDWRIARKADFERMEFLFFKAIEASFKLYFNNIVNLAKSKLNLEESSVEEYFKNNLQYLLTQEHIDSLNQLEQKLKN